MEHTFLEWDAYEYHHTERTTDWYWSVGIIAVAIAVLAILFNNILFGIFIIISAIAGCIYAAREPELIHIELVPKGVVVNKLLYRYNTLTSFWIDEHHHKHPRLVLTSKKLFMPHIIILIDHQSSDDIRAYLLQHLSEEHHHDSIFHHLLERIGF